MSYIETDPGTGVLFVGVVLFALLGFLTLTGTWAIIIYLALLGVVALALYFVAVRVVKWGRGESSRRGRRRDISPERERR